MGALHRGHMALVEAARAEASRVVVSIFVNPTQFGPNEDFERYPRPREHDVKLLRDAGVDAAWLPSVAEMYPEGCSTRITAGSASAGLDGDARPGHFDGVATVVAKLLLQVGPDVALFGQKDYQQLCVIKQLVADLNINTHITGVPTVREADGLALSSRNQYLTDEERAIAPTLHALLMELAGQLHHTHAVTPALCRGLAAPRTPTVREPDGWIPAQGRDDSRVLNDAKAAILAAGFSTVDYLELRAEDTLAPLSTVDGPARLLVAAWLGKTRLIDNIKVG
jgi:pantoate--beta-alanine ligase